jgi:predicted enzyme related to lactoylglutathione lyase
MPPMSRDQFPDEIPSHRSVDFWVEDADGTAEKATEQGGAVIVPRTMFQVSG